MAKLHFTKTLIDAIEPTGTLQSFTDDHVPGLTMLVTPNGVKTFYFIKKHKGRVERTLLGRFPMVTVQQARTQCIGMHGSYAQGISVADARRAERRELTLTQFFAIYHRDHCALHNRRPQYAQYTFEQYIRADLGSRRLSELRRADIQHWHRALGARLPRTANKAHALLRAILNKALAWEYLTGDNPARFVQRFRETARDRFLSPSEVQRFHAALAAERNETARDALLVLLLTGARKSEVLNMRWRDVDLETGIWRVPEPKNGEPFRRPLAGAVKALLERRRAAVEVEVPWVFPGRPLARLGGQARPLREIKRVWDRLLERAGLEDFRIHDLRRTFGSAMLAEGADLLTIGKALGHKDTQSTLIYARLALDPVRAAAEKAAARLNPVLAETPTSSPTTEFTQ